MLLFVKIVSSLFFYPTGHMGLPEFDEVAFPVNVCRSFLKFSILLVLLFCLCKKIASEIFIITSIPKSNCIVVAGAKIRSYKVSFNHRE